MDSKFKQYLHGVKNSVPIMVGYLPVAITFGILCGSNGLRLIDVFLSSFVLYSGAAQFMLVDFMNTGVPIVGIGISVFLINTRLFLMSASLGATVNNVNKKAFPIVGWLLTDESFSILSFNKKHVTTAYTLGVQTPAYLVWGGFSVLGYFIGNFLPTNLQIALGMGLLGLFIAILVPNVKKHTPTVKVVAITILIYVTIHYLNIFPLGWDIVTSIILSSIVGIILLGNYEITD